MILYKSLLLNKAIINYYKANYLDAIRILKKDIQNEVNLTDSKNLVTKFLYLGKSYYKIDAYQKSIHALNTTIQISERDKFYFPELFEVYYLLAENHIKLNNVDKAKDFFNKYKEINERQNKVNTTLINKIYKEYDIQNLKEKIQDASRMIEREKKINFILIISIIVLTLFSVVTVLLFRKKQRDNKNKFRRLLAHIEALEQNPDNKEINYPNKEDKASKEDETSEEDELIDQKLIKIFKNLDSFEKKEYYLNVGCSLNFTAKKLKIM